jgi:hypothetical protein
MQQTAETLAGRLEETVHCLVHNITSVKIQVQDLSGKIELTHIHRLLLGNRPYHQNVVAQ